MAKNMIKMMIGIRIDSYHLLKKIRKRSLALTLVCRRQQQQ